jgi:hypothetical protein
MTPKQYAEELYSTMYGHTPVRNTIAEIEEDKQCAKRCTLTAVDEIIAQIEPSVSMDVISARIKYWQEVKQEIEKI